MKGGYSSKRRLIRTPVNRKRTPAMVKYSTAFPPDESERLVTEEVNTAPVSTPKQRSDMISKTLRNRLSSVIFGYVLSGGGVRREDVIRRPTLYTISESKPTA